MPLSLQERMRNAERQIERLRLHTGNTVATIQGGRPYATKVVAAADSVATDATNADYICNGAADDVQINEAMLAVVDGGRVILLDGTFVLDASIHVSSGIEVVGLGRNVTTILGAIDQVVVNEGATGVRVADLGFAGVAGTGVGVQSISPNELRVENCFFDELADGVLLTTPKRSSVFGCLFNACGVRVQGV